MNEILKKATEELAKEKPDIAYVRGMLETLLAMNTPTYLSVEEVQTSDRVMAEVLKASEPMDEASILDSMAKNALPTIPSILPK